MNGRYQHLSNSKKFLSVFVILAMLYSFASVRLVAAAAGDLNWDNNLGIPGLNNEVHALALDSSGNVYAAGSFTTAGGASVNRIAKWDGSVWSALGTGLNNTVHALAFDSSGNLYAGGSFTTAGGMAANSIAKWDGSGWSALGSGMSGTGFQVRTLAVDSSDNLYAGGFFHTADGVTVKHIAKWDGAAWSALGTGMDQAVFSLAFDSSGNLYAGGQFYSAGGTPANRVAKWNGSSWSALGTGMDIHVYALAFDNDDTLYAGGYFNTAGGVPASSIAKWDGSSWSPLGSGVSGVNQIVNTIVFDSSSNLYAGADNLDQVISYALEPDLPAGQSAKKILPAGLTHREAEILRELAQGATDTEIAERLFISPRTVNAHLTSIYNKLGVSSRAAATRYAFENGLA